MMTKQCLILYLLGLLVFSSGCAPRDRRGNLSGRSRELLNQKDIAPTIELIDKSGLQKLIQERNGKMLLLNFWATWCQPCVEEFPYLVKLSTSHEKNDLEVIGISVDFPDEVESKVVPFLTMHAVPFKVYVAKFDKEEDFINAVDVSWNGAVPATFIYDSLGKKQISLIGERSYDEFKKEIEQLTTRIE